MLSNEAIKWPQQGHSQMDKLTVIESIIRKHGARAVFDATFEWEGDDYASLEAMGFAPMLEDMDRVPSIAYIAYLAHHRMSAITELRKQQSVNPALLSLR